MFHGRPVDQTPISLVASQPRANNSGFQTCVVSYKHEGSAAFGINKVRSPDLLSVHDGRVNKTETNASVVSWTGRIEDYFVCLFLIYKGLVWILLSL